MNPDTKNNNTNSSKSLKDDNTIQTSDKTNNAKYNVINGHTGASYTPPNLGTFMGALEAYYRGMELTDEDRECLKSQGVIN